MAKNKNEQPEAVEEVKVEEPQVEATASSKVEKKSKKDKVAEKQALKAKKEKEKAKAKKAKAKEEDDNGEPKLRDVFKMVFDNTKKKKQEPIVQKRVKRVKTDYQNGLSADQVQERVLKGQTNETPNTNVKTIRSILMENIFTFFNILCFIIALFNFVFKVRDSVRYRGNLLFERSTLVSIHTHIILYFFI